MFEQDPKYNGGPDPSEIEVEVASGPVYVNDDVGAEPSPQYDDIVASSGDEVPNGYPEGAYQTWSPRQEDQFGFEEAVDAVKHFFSGATGVATVADDEVDFEGNVGYHTKSGSGW